ncbi:hypothetical protein Tco_1495912, partial [Tanacetum coccineum]
LKNFYEALEKSIDCDHSDHIQADLAKAHKKRAFGAPGTSGASGSSQLPPSPPPLSTGTSGSAQQQGSKAPSSSKIAASASQSMAWTTFDTQYESANIPRAQGLSLTDYLMQDDSVLEEQIGDMTTFMNWYCQKVNKTVLTQVDFEGQAYEVVKAFYPDVIHLQFQMEECHTMLTAQVDWTNPEGDHVRIDVNRPLPLGKQSCTIGLSKMKAVVIHGLWLELLVPGTNVDFVDVSQNTHADSQYHQGQSLSRYGYDYLSKIVLRRADFQEHTIAEKDLKNLYPSDFEDLNLLLLQCHLDHLPGSDKRMLFTAVKLWSQNLDATGYEFKHDYTIIESPRAVVFPIDNNDRKIMRFNKIYKFSDGTLTRILEALDYRVKEFKVKRLNPGMNTRFWTQKDVTRSKEFIAAIERRLKTRRIYRNLECFVGDINYMLLQRTE